MQALCPATQQQQSSRAGARLFWLLITLLFLPLFSVASPSGDNCEILYDYDDPALFEFVDTRQQVDFGRYQGRTIGEIHYAVLPIFNEDDPAEDNWLYRLANWLHIETRNTTLEKQMILLHQFFNLLC